MNSYLEHHLTTKQIAVLFLLFAILFHLDKVLLGPYAPIRMHDLFEAEFGRYVGLGNLILKHGFFSWNPNLAGGMPSFAYHFGPLHLNVLLATIFPIWFIGHFQVVLLMTLAGYGMCRFIQIFIDIPQNFALLGGLLFALNSQLPMSSLPFMQFNFAFPFFFLCLHSSLNASPGATNLASRLFWLILFAWWSYPINQIAFPVLHLALIFFLTPSQKALRKRWIYQFCLYWVGYSLLFIPSVHALLDYIPFQHRSYPEAINSSTSAAKYFYGFLEYTWHNIFARFSINSLLFPLLIASIPLIIISREVRRFAYLLIFFIILAGTSGSELAGLYAGTFLEKIETRFTFVLLPFVLTLYGVVAIKTLSQQSVSIRSLCIGLAFGSLFYLYTLDNNCCGLSPNAVPAFKILNTLVALGVFLYMGSSFLTVTTSSSSKNFPRNATWVLMLFIIIGALGVSKLARFVSMDNKIYKRHFESHSVFREIANEASSNPFRVAMIGNRPTIAETYGLEYMGGRGPLFNQFYKDYFKLLVWPQLMKDPEKKIFFETYDYELYLQRGDQAHPEFKYNLQPSARDWNLPLFLAANVKYVISNRIITGMNRFATSVKITDGEWYSPNSSWALKPWELTDRMVSSIELMRIGPVGRRREPVRYFIYEMKDYLQRAYLASGAIVFSTRKEVLEALGEATVIDLKSRVFLAKEDAGGLENFLDNGKNQLKMPEHLEFLSYEPDRITIQVATQGPKMLIVSNNYDPKWKAFVNGQETKIIRANHAFQGILLPVSGENRIELIYSDPILPWMFIAIPLGVLLIFAAARLNGNPPGQIKDAKSSISFRSMG